MLCVQVNNADYVQRILKADPDAEPAAAKEEKRSKDKESSKDKEDKPAPAKKDGKDREHRF